MYSVANIVVRTRPHPDVPAEGDGRRPAAIRDDDGKRFTASMTTSVITQARCRHTAAQVISAKDYVQDSRSGLQVPSWTGSGISVWILQVDDRPFTSAAISQCVPDVCSAHTDDLRRQFYCQWTSSVEQFTCGTAFKCRLRGVFQKTPKDLSV